MNIEDVYRYTSCRHTKNPNHSYSTSWTCKERTPCFTASLLRVKNEHHSNPDAGDWSFYQIGVSENGGSPNSRNQDKARTSEVPRNHPLSLSPFPSFGPMVKRPNGSAYFRAFGPKQAEDVRIMRVRCRRKRCLAAARRRVSRASKRRHLPSTMYKSRLAAAASAAAAVCAAAAFARQVHLVQRSRKTRL